MNITSNEYQSIHTPGSIQPHGVLLVLSVPELIILQVSSNTQGYLGAEPTSLLSQPLSKVVDLEQVKIIKQNLEDNSGVNLLRLSILVSGQKQYFDCSVHRRDDLVILELEPTDCEHQGDFFSFQTLVTRAIATLQSTSELREFLQLVTLQIQHITNFDRVMVYEFDASGAGKVVAETKLPELPSYLGLHYPATDIPEPSRQLYQRCLLRFIRDLNAEPVKLISLNHPVTNQPVDLSQSVLRSADPCCVEYHQNMGVAALLVIPLVKNSQLWGLISCHHQTPQHLSTEVRGACELIGQFISLELDSKVNREELEAVVKLKSLHSEFVASISQAEDFQEALVNPEPRLLELVNAQGAAVCLDETITLVGNTPTLAEIQNLLLWADDQVQDSLFCTNSLPKLYPLAETYHDRACGLLLLRISQIKRYYILWFRPEVIQTVNWAGNPYESIQVDGDGKVTLSPRNSFAQWQEEVRLTSLPWQDFEQQSALDLRNAIVGIVLKKADELAEINQELQRSNQELDSFAFAASHDLKEPLRGIHNYSMFLLEDYGEILDEAGIEKLQTLVNLTERMERLIDVLLKFSRLGQTQLKLKPVNLNKLVERLINVLRASRQDTTLDIRIPRLLPTIQCDLVLVNELLSNLLSNALKYNNQPEPWVEIGYLNVEEQRERGLILVPQSEEIPLLFYVRDNGIGIRQRHIQNIFRLFKRLHSQKKYGGGTGAGLTIAKKIVERHGGRIWVNSSYGEGSTFYFYFKLY